MSCTDNFQGSKADQLSPAFTSTLARAITLLIKGPVLLWQFWRMRSELAALAGMDRRELADIGLMPTDISNALASIGPDKTGMLARVVDQRRIRQEQ